MITTSCLCVQASFYKRPVIREGFGDVMTGPALTSSGSWVIVNERHNFDIRLKCFC